MVQHYLKAAIFIAKQNPEQSKSQSAITIWETTSMKTPLGKSMAFHAATGITQRRSDKAQEAKFDSSSPEKPACSPGMDVLDIGCGFGSFMKFAAQHYGIKGVGINISKEQVAFEKIRARICRSNLS